MSLFTTQLTKPLMYLNRAILTTSEREEGGREQRFGMVTGQSRENLADFTHKIIATLSLEESLVGRP